MRAASLLAVCSAGLVGCLLTASLGDLTGGTGPTSDAGDVEASSDGRGDSDSSRVFDGGGGPSDGGSDGAEPLDTSVPPDSGVADGAVDVGLPPADASVPFCKLARDASAYPRVFCDDFEEGTAGLNAKWQQVSGATLDPALFLAPPSPGHSLLADVPPDASTTSSAATAVSASVTNVELSFWVWMSSAPDGDNSFLAQINVGSGLELAFMVGWGGGSPQIQEFVNGTFHQHNSLSTLGWNLGQWVHVDIQLKLVAGASKITVTLNGSTLMLNADSLNAAWAPGAPTVTLEASPANGGDPKATTVNFDNVEVFAN